MKNNSSRLVTCLMAFFMLVPAGILFGQSDKQIRIHTDHTDLIFTSGADGRLYQSYFGPALNQMPEFKRPVHVAYATYFERKIIGHMQVRLGPMRVGWHGLLQPIADGIKSFFKEDIIPAQADKPTFLAAPIICLVAMMTSLAVLPFAKGWVLADIDIGLLFIFAMSSLASYGVVLACWASNS